MSSSNAGRPNYTQAALGVTGAAETSIIATTFCGAIYVNETTATKAMLFRGSVPGSAQQPVLPGTLYRIPGPFAPRDFAGTFELAAAGSAILNVAELQS